MSTSLLVVEVLVYEQLEKRRFPITDQRPLTPIASLGGSFKAQPQRKRNEWEEVEKAIQSAVQR